MKEFQELVKISFSYLNGEKMKHLSGQYYIYNILINLNYKMIFFILIKIRIICILN